MIVKEYEYKEVDARLDRMIEMAEEQNVSLDSIVKAIGRVDQKAFLASSERPSTAPR